MDDGSGLSTDPQELGVCIEEAETKIAELETQVAEEIAKMEGYRVSKGGGKCGCEGGGRRGCEGGGRRGCEGGRRCGECVFVLCVIVSQRKYFTRSYVGCSSGVR